MVYKLQLLPQKVELSRLTNAQIIQPISILFLQQFAALSREQFINLVLKATMKLKSGFRSGTQLLSTTHVKFSYKSGSACSDKHESSIDIPTAWYIPRE